MLSLQRIALHDFALYKEESFDFVEGLTVVRGQNYSGKSLMFSPIRTLLFDEGSIPGGSKAILTGTRDGTPFDITGWSQGKSNRYSLTIDNKDQRTDTIAKAREAIDTFLSIPASLYSTTIGLTGLAPHPLASGKPSTRLEWIHATLAFAELYDSYMEKVEQRIKETKSKAIEYDVLSKELDRLLKEEPPVPDKQPKMDTEAVSHMRELQKRKDALSALIHGPSEPDMSLNEVESQLKKTESRLDRLVTLQRQWKDYRKQKATWTEHVSMTKETLEQVVELCDKLFVPKKFLQDTQVLIQQVNKQILLTTEKIRDAEENNRLYDEQEDLRRAVSIRPSKEYADLKDAKRVLQETNDMLSYYSVALSKTGDVCAFCGKDLATDKKKAKKEVEALTEKRAEAEAAREYYRAKKVELVEYVSTEKKKQRLKDLKRLVDLLHRIPQHSTEKPKRPEEDFDEDALDKLTRRRDRLLSVQAQHDMHRRWREKIPDDMLSINNPKREYDSISEEISALTVQVTSLSEKMIQYRTASALRSKWEKEVDELQQRVGDLRRYPRRLRILSLLKQAFGRDGLRNETLQTSLELFLSNLNELATVIWKEPYKFEVDVGPRKCDVIVHRNKRRGSIFSLSGAEQRGWQLISALSLIRLLPSSSRCDTIILDELEANSTRETRQRFVYDFLPELQRSVPKVVIVTPLSADEFSVPCDREFTVVKKNAQSQLKQKV